MKPPWNFSFFYFIPGNSKLNPLIFQKIVLDPFETPRPKTPGNSTFFFLFTLGYSTPFLINPWKFLMFFFETPGNSTCYFFETPGNSISSTSPVWIFSRIAQCKQHTLYNYLLGGQLSLAS